MAHLITLRETTERVGYCAGYIKQLSKRGDFPAIVRIAGNDPDRARIHFLEVEVEDWLAARKSMSGGKASRQGCRKPRPSLERMVAELTARVAKLEAGA